MAAAYILSIIMALFAGALPAQLLAVVWEQICDGMNIEIPYVALMRILAAAGAILAVILSDRIRGYILARDVIVGALALETMCLIGFSMSRELWNLAVWIFALGFSSGLCLSLICYLLREVSAKRAGGMFSSSALGIAAGTMLSNYILSSGHSWRTACQIIAIVQIVLCMIIFCLRRTLLKDVVSIVRKQRREARILRERRRQELIRQKGDVDESFEGVYLFHFLSMYGAALCCSMLLLCAVHLTFTAQVSLGDGSADIVQSILIVCSAMAVGRILIFLLKKNGITACRIGAAVTLLGLGVCAIAAAAGYHEPTLLMIARIVTGCGAGMVFPNLIQIEDERIDPDAQTSMAGLIPAFYLGSEALITHFVQSLAGASKSRICVYVMFAMACCMGICLFLSSSRGKRRY